MISGGQIQSFSLFAIVDSGQQSEGFPVFLSQSVYFFSRSPIRLSSLE